MDPISLLVLLLVVLLVCALFTGGVVPAFGTQGVRVVFAVCLVLLILYLLGHTVVIR